MTIIFLTYFKHTLSSQLHEVFPDFDYLSDDDLSCDIVCLVYDVSNPYSFEYCTRVFKVKREGCAHISRTNIQRLRSVSPSYLSNISWTARPHVWLSQQSRTCQRSNRYTTARRWNSAGGTRCRRPSPSPVTPLQHPAEISTLNSPPWPCTRK